MSCNPSTNRNTNPRVACVNANLMEVLVLYHPKDEPEGMRGFLICARSSLEQRFGTLARARQQLKADSITPSPYKSAGYDQCRVRFSSIEQAKAIVRNPVIATAIGLLVFRLMRKGVTLFARNHCAVLADEVLR
jgi:hypothetical protein